MYFVRNTIFSVLYTVQSLDHILYSALLYSIHYSLKGVVSRDFSWLQMILMYRSGVADIPLDVYLFVTFEKEKINKSYATAGFLFSKMTRFWLQATPSLLKEMKCSGDFEILHKIVCDNTRISSCFSDFRVVLRTISFRISKSWSATLVMSG